MLKELKQDVLAANLLLPVYKLMTFTWENVSEIDRSGVEYDRLTAVDLESGKTVEGRLPSSSDTTMHLVLYRNFPDIKGVVHNAVVLEELAFMAWHNLSLTPDTPPMKQELLDKHFLRKHGKNAYYGQEKV